MMGPSTVTRKLMPPSILFVNRVYPPTPGATGKLLAELAETLAAHGWRVSVIASRPENSPAQTESRNGVSLLWVRGLPFTRSTHWRRALSYVSLYPALLWRALCAPRHDITVMLTDPPLQFVFGAVLRLFKGTSLVHWAQDIYPEIAEQLGVIKPGGLVAGSLRRISTFALRRFDRIVVVGECMKHRLLARELRAERLALITNWAPPEIIRLDEKPNEFCQEQRSAERFVVMYSGNLGLAHTFDAMLDAAEVLQREEPRVLFLVVGDGPRLDWVRGQSQLRQLHNVRFLPPQPASRLAEVLGAAHVHLITMRDELRGLVVPSKLYGILAVGRPVIFIGPRESEVAREIEREGVGTVLPVATGMKLAATIREWASDEARLNDIARRAHDLANRSSLKTAAERFGALFYECLRASDKPDALACQSALIRKSSSPDGAGKNLPNSAQSDSIATEQSQTVRT